MPEEELHAALIDEDFEDDEGEEEDEEDEDCNLKTWCQSWCPHMFLHYEMTVSGSRLLIWGLKSHN